ncbi:MAG: hypothetical protein R2865_14805 [Deinococcales bacterium]
MTAKAARNSPAQSHFSGRTYLTSLSYVTSMRGWGRSLKRAIANWYQAQGSQRSWLSDQTNISPVNLGATVTSCVSHPKANNGPRDALYQYIVSKEDKFTKANKLAHVQETWADYLRLIQNLPQASQSEVIEGIKPTAYPVRSFLPVLTDASVGKHC